MPEYLRRLLMGSTAVMAPDDDQGAAFDDVDADLDLDEIDERGTLDDGDDPEGDEVDAEAGEGDEAEDDGQGDTGAAGRQPSRRERDIGALRAERRAAEQRAADAERRLNELLSQQTRTQTAAAQQQEQELLASMTETERLSYMLNRQAQTFKTEIDKLRFEQADSADQVKFDALCARNPTAAKLRDEVEKKLADLRKTGSTAPRETVLKFVLGERALERAGKTGTKQRKRAEGAVAAQRTRPASPRSDATAEDRRALSEAEARRKRLENMTF